MPSRRFRRSRNRIQLMSNPLYRMGCDRAGLYPFPVEIWQIIFSWIEEPLQYSKVAEDNFHYFFSEEDETYLCDPEAYPPQGVSKELLSIILVCRSWYFVGIPFLWSHLIFHGTDTNDFTTQIHNALKRDPDLAPCVYQLTVTRQYAHPFKWKEGTIITIIQLLPNLSVISCPVGLSEKINCSFSDKTALIRADTLPHWNAKNYISSLQRFVSGALFSYQCHTLSFTFIDGHIDTTVHTTQVRFPNLVNLRLCIGERTVLQWISESWQLPVLKDLSLTVPSTCKYEHGLSRIPLGPLLYRTHRTVERLQLSDAFSYIGAPIRVEMTQLKEIQWLTYSNNRYKPSSVWLHAFDGPRLERYVFYIDSRQLSYSNYPEILSHHIGSLRESWPVVKEVGIISRNGHWGIAPHDRNLHMILTPTNIEDWCKQGFQVEIVSLRKGVRRVYMAESFAKGGTGCNDFFYLSNE